MDLEFFPDQRFLRLRSRSHGTYLHADEDGVRVSLKPHRAYLNTAWQVHRVLRHGGDEYVLLCSAAYGRYLALSPETSEVFTGHRANLTCQAFYETPDQDDVLWVPFTLDEGGRTDVLLLHASDRFLRASPCNLYKVFVDHAASAGNTIQWVVEAIPLRPEPLLFRPDPVETIFYTRADDQGNLNPLSRRSFEFYGNSVLQLRDALATQLNEPAYCITLSVRAGSQGRLTPLVMDLPSSRHAMDIIVLTTYSQAALELRYPDVDAP